MAHARQALRCSHAHAAPTPTAPATAARDRALAPAGPPVGMEEVVRKHFVLLKPLLTRQLARWLEARAQEALTETAGE